MTDDELSAYSARGMYSMLTEEVLAQKFKEDFEKRKAVHRERWRGVLTTPIRLVGHMDAIAAAMKGPWRVLRAKH
jgi:hypothetical protein